MPRIALGDHELIRGVGLSDACPFGMDGKHEGLQLDDSIDRMALCPADAILGC